MLHVLIFSHADHEEHERRITRIRKVSKEKNRFIGILADTKGPEIRTGEFENGVASFIRGEKS